MAERQAPTPSNGNAEDTDLRSVAAHIETMLDDDGHYNPDGRASRALDPESYDDPGEAAKPTPERDPKTGRFAKAAEQSEQEEPDVEVEDEQDAAGDVEDEDTIEDGDTDEQLADSAVDEDLDSESPETDNITTVAELAEALDMTREAFLESITDTFGAAGEEVTVTLADQLKGYQKDADYRRGTQQLAEQKQLAEHQYQEQMQHFEQGHRLLAQHLNATEALITAKLEDPALQRLRDTDPAEWSARNSEIARDLNMVQNARTQAAQQFMQQKADYETGLRHREMEALKQVLPDFGEVHKAQSKEIMKSVGYTDQEISNIYDHRLVLASLELAALRAENAELTAAKAKAADTVKRVKKEVPKLQKPGKKRTASPQGIKRDKLANLQKRAAKTGDVRDAAAVIEHMMTQ